MLHPTVREMVGSHSFWWFLSSTHAMLTALGSFAILFFLLCCDILSTSYFSPSLARRHTPLMKRDKVFAFCLCDQSSSYTFSRYYYFEILLHRSQAAPLSSLSRAVLCVTLTLYWTWCNDFLLSSVDYKRRL